MKFVGGGSVINGALQRFLYNSPGYTGSVYNVYNTIEIILAGEHENNLKAQQVFMFFCLFYYSKPTMWLCLVFCWGKGCVSIFLTLISCLLPSVWVYSCLQLAVCCPQCESILASYWLSHALSVSLFLSPIGCLPPFILSLFLPPIGCLLPSVLVYSCLLLALSCPQC